MKTDQDLQKDVEQAIRWQPLLHAAAVAVAAQYGIIILAGNVDSYAKKSDDEDAAKSVADVKVVIEEIEVSLNCIKPVTNLPGKY